MYQVKSLASFAKDLASITVTFVAAYAALYFLIPSMLDIPDGPIYAVIVTWLLGHIGGFIAVQCRMPALLGMLLIGMVFKNAIHPMFDAYLKPWELKVKAFGLCTILLRAGLKIDYRRALRTAPAATLLLAALPIFAEGFLDAGLFVAMFKMPFLLAASAGFLLSAISPTVIVTGMIDLHMRGYGALRAIPSIEMAGAGLDVVIGIAMHSIFDALSMAQAVKDNSDAFVPKEGAGVDPAWRVMRGAVAIPLGFAASVLGGLLLGCTRVFNSKLNRTLAVMALGHFFIHLYITYKLTGAGALASIGVTSFASIFWSLGWPKYLSTGPQPNAAKYADEQLAVFWVYVMQPLLFATIGTSIDFKYIPGATIPKALVVIAVGSIGRVLSAGLAVLPSRTFPWREVIFFALTWIPKATVQGALSSNPLYELKTQIDPSRPDYDRWVGWGTDILATSVLSIIFTAPIGLLLINLLTPRLLERDGEDGADGKDGKDGKDGGAGSPKRTSLEVKKSPFAAVAAATTVSARQSLENKPNAFKRSSLASNGSAAAAAGAGAAGADAGDHASASAISLTPAHSGGGLTRRGSNPDRTGLDTLLDLAMSEAPPRLVAKTAEAGCQTNEADYMDKEDDTV